MSIVIKDQGGRSQLQERLAAELKAKLAAQSGSGDKPSYSPSIEQDTPDLVNDSEYLKNFQQKSSPHGRVIAIIVISVVIMATFGLILAIAN
jgi:hypothetical protein